MPENECKKVKLDDTRKSQLISFHKEKEYQVTQETKSERMTLNKNYFSCLIAHSLILQLTVQDLVQTFLEASHIVLRRLCTLFIII